MAKRPSQKLLEALADLAKALQFLESPNMVIGGIAAIAHGVARQTIDVDATLLARGISTTQALRAFEACGIHPRIPDLLKLAEKSQVLLLVHGQSGVPLEVSFAFTEFEQDALAKAIKVDFGEVEIRVPTPEDLVIYKALAWGDRDRYDIEQLLTLHSDAIDLGRVRRFVQDFASILESPERIPDFDELTQRILRSRA